MCNSTALPNNNVTFINNDTCVNWNYYYTECKGQGNNPFQGTISFDNIGLAWVAIFLVRALVTRPTFVRIISARAYRVPHFNCHSWISRKRIPNIEQYFRQSCFGFEGEQYWHDVNVVVTLKWFPQGYFKVNFLRAANMEIPRPSALAWPKMYRMEVRGFPTYYTYTRALVHIKLCKSDRGIFTRYI